VYEVFATVSGHAVFDLIILDLSAVVELDGEDEADSYQALCKIIGNCDISNSVARDPDDYNTIMKLIKDGPGRLQVNATVGRQLLDAVATIAANHRRSS